MRKVTFEFKGQMVNYYNKVLESIKNGSKIKAVNYFFDLTSGKWTVAYSYR